MRRKDLQERADRVQEVLLSTDVGIRVLEVVGAVLGFVQHIEDASDGDAGDDGIHVGGAGVSSHEFGGRIRLEGLEGKESPPDGFLTGCVADAEHSSTRIESEDVEVAPVSPVATSEHDGEGPLDLAGGLWVAAVGEDGVKADALGNAAEVVETVLRMQG